VDAGEFNQKVDDILSALEDELESCDADLDWDVVGGILTIECENGSQVIMVFILITSPMKVAGNRVNWNCLPCSIKA